MPYDPIFTWWFWIYAVVVFVVIYAATYFTGIPPNTSVGPNDTPVRRWHRFLDWPSNRYDAYNNYAPWWLILLRGPGMFVCFIATVLFCFGVFLATLSWREVRAAWYTAFSR